MARKPIRRFTLIAAFALLAAADGVVAQDAEWKALTNEADALFGKCRCEQAIAVAQRALGVAQKLGPGRPEIGFSLGNLGQYHRWMGRYSQAEAFYERAAAFWEGSGAADPAIASSRLVWSLLRLGQLNHDIGRHARAEQQFARALAAAEKSFGPDAEQVADVLRRWGYALLKLDWNERAASLYQRAIAIVEKAYGREHANVASVMVFLAHAYRGLGRAEDAERVYLRVAAIREKALPPEDPLIATDLNNLGGFYQAQGDDARAEPLLKRALAMREKLLGAEDRDTSETRSRLATLYRKAGRTGEAEALAPPSKGPVFDHDAWDRKWGRYKRTTVADMKGLFDYDHLPADYVGFTLNAQALAKPYRLRAIYLGRERDIPAHKLQIIRKWWGKDYRVGDDFTALFEQEMLFEMDGEQFWMPVQKVLIPDVKKELRSGNLADVLFMVVGTIDVARDGHEWILLVNEFQKKWLSD